MDKRYSLSAEDLQVVALFAAGYLPQPEATRHLRTRGLSLAESVELLGLVDFVNAEALGSTAA